MSAIILPDVGAAVADPASWLGRQRRAAELAQAVRRRAAAACGNALLAAAPAPLLMGFASATGSEPITLGLAGLTLTSLALQVRRLHSAARIMTRHRDNLARLAAPAVARLVAETDAVTLRAGWEQEATVLFADIRDFTGLCETLSPGDVAAFLAEFRRRAAGAIEAAGGLVDKFVGDEVMAVFGVPRAAPDDTDRAVVAARSLAAAMLAWSRERARAGLSPVRIGVGLHRGGQYRQRGAPPGADDPHDGLRLRRLGSRGAVCDVRRGADRRRSARARRTCRPAPVRHRSGPVAAGRNLKGTGIHPHGCRTGSSRPGLEAPSGRLLRIGCSSGRIGRRGQRRSASPQAERIRVRHVDRDAAGLS
ncbi:MULTISPECIES: adenylate/guanylate cyclase domain-containing protein [Methylobacterium]|uniref:adenylate/guanylate cyclase domain-containing protein n=1 Tax=Methylobacterium TaxID=407 RepID=UPI001EE2BF2D|nr:MULTISPECIES: adenylate/guanylate cyclase domain-containing protein [Methylobacterium]